MLTMNYIIKQKYSLDYRLNDIDIQHLINENIDNNYSYLALFTEMCRYKPTTVRNLLRGWSGVVLFKV